jgi:hypothetical protein
MEPCLADFEIITFCFRSADCCEEGVGIQRALVVCHELRSQPGSVLKKCTPHTRRKMLTWMSLSRSTNIGMMSALLDMKYKLKF